MSNFKETTNEATTVEGVGAKIEATNSIKSSRSKSERLFASAPGD